MTNWKNRIIGTEERDPRELTPNPDNWRTHPVKQRSAATDALSQLGWVAPVMLNTTTGRLIDGHMRVELAIKNGEPTVPVLLVELSEEEERAALASLDPLGDLAGRDQKAFDQLLDSLALDDGTLLTTLGLMATQEDALSMDDRLKEWGGMPEFLSQDKTGAHRIIVNFKTVEDFEDFCRKIGQDVGPKARSIWHPEVEWADEVSKRYADPEGTDAA